MDDDITIEPLSPGFVDQIEGWSNPEAVRVLRGLPETGVVGDQMGWVAVVGGQPIAVATVNAAGSATGFLDFAVKPEERRQGVGARLVAYVLDQAAVNRFARLSAAVELDNTAAQKILTRNGFSRVGFATDGRLEYERR